MLQFYDADKRFPAWGFGARPIDGPVSHCFNLNGSSHHCEVWRLRYPLLLLFIGCSCSKALILSICKLTFLRLKESKEL